VTALALGLLGPSAPAEVPFQEATGLYAQTNPDFRQLSPIWGMVALKGNILARILRFGNYAARPNPRYPRHWLADPRACPQDAPCALLQHLFQRPDALGLVPLEAREDPVGQIAREARANRGNDTQAGGLRRLQPLLDAIVGYRRQLQSLKPGAAGVTDADRRAAVASFLDDVKRILAPPAGPAQPSKEFTGRLNDFARVLERAVVDETLTRRATYPPNIVETALLAYAWMVADSAGELYDAFADATSGGLLTRPAEDAPQARFTAEYYDAHLAAFRERLHRGGDGAPSPEEIALFAIGYRNFDCLVPHLPVPRLTTYRDKDRKFASEYQDPGETALRNFFIVLFHGRAGFDEQRMAALLGRFPEAQGLGLESKAEGRLVELRRFFRLFPRIDQQATDEAHEAWGALVADLDRPGDPLPIDYAHTTHGIPWGLEPMLNVIAHLLPDPELNRPWPRLAKDRPQEAARKLDRLCHLCSQSGRELDWRVGSGKALQDLKPVVTFRVNGVPAFCWGFAAETRDLLALRQAASDSWPDRALPDVGDARLRSLLLPHQEPSAFAIDPGQPWQVFAADLGSPRATLELVDQLLRLDNLAYHRLLAAVIQTLPKNVPGVDQLAKVFEAHPKAAIRSLVYPLPRVLLLPEANKAEFLLQALETRHPAAARLLLEHRLSVDSRGPQGDPLVFEAIRSGRLDMLEFFIRAKVNLRVQDRDGAGPLAVAVRSGHNGLLLPLLHAGAGPVDPALLKLCAETGNQEALATLSAFKPGAGAGSAARTETPAAGPSGLESKRDAKPEGAGPMFRRPESKR